MKQPDRLFLLIKSLTKNEKIYFKRYSEKVDNNYLLFDAILQQQEYDEKLLINSIGKQKFGKQFRMAKSRLFYAILKSLQDYYYIDSANNTTKHVLQHIEIFYKRALYEPCLKIISQAKKKLYEINDAEDVSLLELIRWEQRLCIMQNRGFEKTGKSLALLKEEAKLALEKYNNSWQMRFLLDEILVISSKNVIDFDRKAVEKLIRNPLVQREKNALSPKARFWFHYFWCTYHHLMENEQAAIKSNQNAIKITEENHVITKRAPDLYLSAYTNLALQYYVQKKYKKTLAAIREIKTFPAETQHLKLLKLKTIYLYELMSYNSIGDFKSAVGLVENIDKNLKEYAEKLPPGILMIFYNQIAYAFFGNEEYKESFKRTNKVLTFPSKGVREDIYNFSTLFYLIICFELGYDDLLISKMRSLQRLYKRKKAHYSTGILFTTFLNKIYHEKNSDKKKKLFMDLKAGLMTSKSSSPLSNIIKWVESKITGRRFASIIKAAEH